MRRSSGSIAPNKSSTAWSLTLRATDHGRMFAALLGVVEGITEFLPISSTAHLRLVPTLLGHGDPGPEFSAVIQMGALLRS